ncbi:MULTISPECIES: DUF4345 domain-containing protein [unclassified Sphingomonas]|jgi:Domain of unknown function (DUF4345)|uniref:DUF4345 domain-containing protein n=1 Tax=unclassified Sphingomonas TaxID=196159 RepID=UPI000E107B0A|nr:MULTISPECIES: DUF4345 domain-containing protein [unclassified Sphingomonas]AXJ95877.1 DUF4345 domain-containing protein [Sphingomonas sp. FARSPH]
MSARLELRLLQVVVAIACLVPLAIGGLGILRGPGFLGHPPVVPRDLDSHFRYVSGIFFAVGVAFVTCIPDIANKGPRFRLLGALIVAGGCARVVSLASVGAPSAGHLFGLAMELGVVPLLMLWQARVARQG